MDIYCTRPNCPDPINTFPAPDDSSFFRTIQQRYCAACTMPLILDGRYLPLKRLGGGAFGTTFLGVDLRSAKQRQCVIKQLQLKGNIAPNQIEGVKKAFRREAEILEVLGDNHQQIPTLYAYFGLTAPGFMGAKHHDPQNKESEEFIYLVQEYVRGHDLDKELRRKGKFTEAEVLDLLKQVLPVLQFVHNHGAIHRDIKPSNMMRDRNNRIYLIDFGAVKQITTGVPLQSNSLVFGTLGFAPPEQIAGKQVYPSTDLYSFAVTALCLLTGQPPEALLDASGDTWCWRSSAQVSNRLERVLDRMLEFIPGRRFQSADAVMEALFQISSSPMPNSAIDLDGDTATAALIDPDETHVPASMETYLPHGAPPPIMPPAAANPLYAKTVTTPPSHPPQFPSTPPPVLSPIFIARCQEELAYCIGPIASLVVEEAISRHSPATLQQLVDILIQDIPDPKAALDFRRKLLS